jgi:hypothetical protein
MAFEFCAIIPRSPPIKVSFLIDTLVLHGICLLNNLETNEGFLDWPDQKSDLSWPSSIRIWIDADKVNISLNGNRNQMEALVWELEKFLSEFYNSPIVFDDL